MPDACKHFWVEQGNIQDEKGARLPIFRCEICGKTVIAKTNEKGSRNGRRHNHAKSGKGPRK